MNASPGRVSSPARLAPGLRVGGVTIAGPLRSTAIAEVYQADGPDGPATLHIVHPAIAANAAVRSAVLAGAQAAAALPEHAHVVRTYGAGVEGDVVWVLTEANEGSTVADLLARKRQTGTTGGFGARGAGNLVVGVAAGLAHGGPHGALSTESIIVSRNGRIRIVDLALARGVAAATAAGLIPAGSHVAPEVARGAPPDETSDVYGLGALLYEALVGRPLERGGPRPSEVVGGLTSQIDELIARSCASVRDKRFGSIEVVKELVAEALGRGAAFDDDKKTAPPPGVQSGPQRISLAQSIATPAAAPVATAVEAPKAAPSPTIAAADPALQAALADTHERFLVAKGRLDYGPFSLKDIVEQIDRGEIVAGNVIIDKDTGQRMNVHDHPLLGPMVDAAKQRIDDARRAQAEVAHQTKEKKRGALLYGMIGLVVVVLGVGIYAIVATVTGGKKDDGPVAGVEKVGGAQLSVTFSQPKRPTAKPSTGKRGGSRGGSRGGGGDNGDEEALALDLSGDEDGGSETLDMNTIYNVYSKYGGQLARCMSRAGQSYALISIIIDGPSGKVTFVRVNGQKGGALAECIGGVMRSMKFPPVDGTRTRAEFDISL